MNFTEEQLREMIAQFEKDSVSGIQDQIIYRNQNPKHVPKKPLKPTKQAQDNIQTPQILKNAQQYSEYPDVLESTVDDHFIKGLQQDIDSLQKQNLGLIGEIDALKIDNSQLKEQNEEIDWHRKKLKQEQIGRARVETKLQKLEEEYKKQLVVAKQSQEVIIQLQQRLSTKKTSLEQQSCQETNHIAEVSRLQCQLKQFEQLLNQATEERDRIKKYYEKSEKQHNNYQDKLVKSIAENKKLKIEIFNLSKELDSIKYQYVTLEQEMKVQSKKLKSSNGEKMTTSQVEKQSAVVGELQLEIKQQKQINLHQKKQFEDRCFKYESAILELQFELQNLKK